MGALHGVDGHFDLVPPPTPTGSSPVSLRIGIGVSELAARSAGTRHCPERRRQLHRGADVVSAAPQVFDLLDYLIRNRERVVSKDDLINAIWNGRIVSDAALIRRA